MKAKQFINSLKQIVHDPHTHTLPGLYRHGLWQIRKILNLFPFVLRFSESRIIAFHKRCGVSALINSRNVYNYNDFMFIKYIFAKENAGYFYDIGANIGAYTIIAKEQKNVTAYAFEPHPVTYEYLERNIEINRLENVHTFNVAAGNGDTDLLFSDDPGSPENKIITGDEKNGINIKSIRLEDYLRIPQISPPPIIFVKIDVEGFELEVLQGCGANLSNIDILQVEIHDLDNPKEKTKQLLAILKENFKGPFSVDYDQNALITNNRHPGDDVIFISKGYLPRLNDQFHVIDSW